jgi:hypothetical protein
VRSEHLLNYGYTPTSQAVLERLAGLLKPVNGGVIRLLDPCCADGQALASLAHALADCGARVMTYGVEIEEERAGSAARVLGHVLCADFRRAVMSHKSISLALLNPPYDQTGGEDSLEKTIIRRTLPYLVEDGIAVLIIPERLLPWVEEKQRMRWLALFASQDPVSPNQVVLIGKPAAEPHALPGLGTMQPVEVPALPEVLITFRVNHLTPQQLERFLAATPLPDLYPVSGEADQRVLHPLHPGHRAAYLAGHGSTIDLPDSSYLRVAIHRLETRREEETEDGAVRCITLSIPKMLAYVLEHGNLREIPFEQITEMAADIDRAISLQSYVEERPDGTPEAQPWEQEVLDHINCLLPPMNGRQGLLPAQAVRAVGMARALLDGQKAVFGLMEMGFGKTPLSLTVRDLLVARKSVDLTVVTSPPHLVKKWGREARRLAPAAQIILPEGNGEERQARVRQALEAAQRGEEVILIISREAVKLGPMHRAGLVPRLFPRKGASRIWSCPSCGAPATTKAEESWGIDEILHFGEWVRASPGEAPPRRFLGKKCPLCQAPYIAPEPKPRRWPLAEPIYRAVKSGHIRNLLLIADEAHEFRNASLQGTAFSRLYRASRWAILLTGTLFGGKASDLYRLLRWTSPEMRQMGLTEKEFVERYGYAESVEIVDEKRSYGRRVRRSEFRERPGVSPGVYRFLLSRTAFGVLRDVAVALPTYTEQQKDIAAPALGLDHLFEKSYGGRLYHEQGKGALSAWLRAALGYYNIAAVAPLSKGDHHLYDFVSRDQDGQVKDHHLVLTLPVLPEGTILPKEQELLDLLRQEAKEKRKTVILVEQTTVRPLPLRLEKILRQSGLRAVYLNTARVPAGEREAWIEKQAHTLDALITHPKAVETGLDLVMFQTVVAYEAIYATISLAQAICRVWRLGQTRPVRVFALGYQGIELDAWDVIARKISWAKSVYGDFVPSALGDAGADDNLDLLRALTERITGVSKEDGAVPLTTLAGIEAPVVAPASSPIPAPDTFHTIVLMESWAEWAARKGMATTSQQRRRLGGPTSPAQLELGME